MQVFVKLALLTVAATVLAGCGGVPLVPGI